MAELLRTFRLESVAYSAGGLVTAGVNTLLIPFYTRHLEPAEFGRLALCETGLIALVNLVVCGLNVALLQECADTDDRTNHRRALTAAIWWCAALAGTGSLLVGVAAALGLPAHADAELPDLALQAILAAIVLAEAELAVLATYLRGTRQAGVLSALSIAQAVGGGALSVYLLIAWGGGVQAVLAARLAATLITAGVAGFHLRSLVGVAVDRQLLYRMLLHGAPTVVSATALTVLLGAGRFQLWLSHDLAAVARFAAATKLAGLLGILLVQPVGLAWLGMIHQIDREGHTTDTIPRLTDEVAALGCAAAVWLAACAPELSALFLGPRYGDSSGLLAPLLVGQVAMALAYPAATGLYLNRSTGRLAALHVAGAATALVTVAVLVERAAATGAAVATAASLALVTALSLASSQRVRPIPFHARRLGALGAVSGLALALLWWEAADAPGSGLAARAAVAGGASLALAWTVRRHAAPPTLGAAQSEANPSSPLRSSSVR